MREPEDQGKRDRTKITLDLADLKEVFGDRIDVACINAEGLDSVEVEDLRGQLMIPANEPCPVNPHNHDGVTADRVFQKVIVIRL